MRFWPLARPTARQALAEPTSPAMSMYDRVSPNGMRNSFAPDFLLKGRAPNHERHCKLAPLAREILSQFVAQLIEQGMFALGNVGAGEAAKGLPFPIRIADQQIPAGRCRHQWPRP